MRPASSGRRRSAPGRARAVAAILLAALVSVSLWTSRTSRAVAADPARDLAGARAAVDRVAEQWFRAQARARALDRRIRDLDERIAGARRRAAGTRGLAARRAAAMYQSLGAGVAAGAAGAGGGADGLVVARRTALLDSANEVAQRDIDRYTAAVTDLRAARRAVGEARRDQRLELRRIAAERRRLDARLAEVQRAYRAAMAARAAAAARAARDAAARAARAQAANASAELAARSTAPPPPPSSAPGDGGPGSGGPGSGGPGPVPAPAPPPPSPGTHPRHFDPFLTCVRERESRGNYGAVNPTGYYGAYQFSPSTWNVTASHAGRPELIGVRPDRASAWDQDDMAWALYQWQGATPWGGGCP